LTDSNFTNVVGKDKHVVVFFYAENSTSPEKRAPELASLAEHYMNTYSTRKDILIAKVNGPRNPNLSARCKVSTYPRVFAFRNGSLSYTSEYLDDMKLRNLKNWIDSTFQYERQTNLEQRGNGEWWKKERIEREDLEERGHKKRETVGREKIRLEKEKAEKERKRLERERQEREKAAKNREMDQKMNVQNNEGVNKNNTKRDEGFHFFPTLIVLGLLFAGWKYHEKKAKEEKKIRLDV